MKKAKLSVDLPRHGGHVSQAARAQGAYAYLKERLLEGDLGPGDNLSVVALAGELQCSRVPVMEALKRLEAEGFVRIVPQVGCRVDAPDSHDVLDFFTLFAAVEGTIASLAAERRTPEDLRTFAAVCAEIDKTARMAGAPEDRDPTYRRLNLLFHRQIHQLARAPAASTVAAGLWDRSDFYIKLAFGSLYFSKRIKASHLAIRKAIADGEPAAAEAAVREHLLAVGAGVAKRLAELQVGG